MSMIAEYFRAISYSSDAYLRPYQLRSNDNDVPSLNVKRNDEFFLYIFLIPFHFGLIDVRFKFFTTQKIYS